MNRRSRRRLVQSVLWALLAVLVVAQAGSASSPEAQFIEQGLNDLTAKARELAGQGVLGEPVPLTGMDPTSAEGLNVDQLLQELLAPLGPSNFDEVDPRTAAGRETMRKELEKLDRTIGGVAVRVGCQGNAETLPGDGNCGSGVDGTPVAVTEDSASSAPIKPIDFTIPIHATRTVTAPMSADAGIANFDGGGLSVALTLETTLPVRVDLNLRTTAPDDAVMLRAPATALPQLSLTATVSGTPNLQADLGFTKVAVGLIGPAPDEGAFTATATLGAQLRDADADGVITRDEWQATAISDLAQLTRSGQVRGQVTLDTDLIPATNPDAKIPFDRTLGSTPSTGTDPGGSFTFPQLDVTDLGALSPFQNITPEQVIAGFGQAGAALAGAQQVGDAPLPFVDGALSKAFAVAKPVFDFVNQQAIVCGTTPTVPPTGVVPDELNNGDKVYCQAFVIHAPDAGTVGNVQWSVRSGVNASDITPAADKPNTIGAAPTKTAVFQMTADGPFDVTASYDLVDAAATPPTVKSSHTTERPAQTAQQLLEKLDDLGGFNTADDTSVTPARKALAYDDATKALRFRLRQTFDPASTKLDYSFGDQLESGTGLIALQVANGVELTADVGQVGLDLTVGLLLGDLAEIGQGQACPDPNQTPCQPNPLDRVFVEVDTTKPEFRVADGQFSMTTKPLLVGRVGFVQVEAEPTTFAIARRDTNADLLQVNVAPPDIDGVPGGPTGLNVGTTNLPNAIRLRELLFRISELVETPQINLRFDGGVAVDARIGERPNPMPDPDPRPSLGSGSVTITWEDVTQGLPQVNAQQTFIDTLTGFNIDPNVFGSHDGATSPSVPPADHPNPETPQPAVLADASGAFTNEMVGKRVENMTDGSFCDITAVDPSAKTITCATGLGGGTDNQWESGDEYRVRVGDPLAMLWQLLDNLDTVVATLDQFGGGSTASDAYNAKLPLVGVSPKELVGQVQELRRTVSELRGGAGPQIACGTTNANPPTGNPADLLLNAMTTSKTLYCQVTNAKAATDVKWTLVRGGSATPGNDTSIATVVTPTSATPQTASFVIEAAQSDNGKIASAEHPNGYRIRAEFVDADGRHVVDFPEQSVPPSLQQFERAIESKLGLLDPEFALGTTGTGSSRRVTIGLNYGMCTEAATDALCNGIARQAPGIVAPLNVDLGGDTGGLVGLGSDGSVAVKYSALATLNMSFAVDPNLDPKVEPGTGLAIKGRVSAPSVNLEANLGPIGVQLAGQVHFGADFNVTGPTTAVAPGAWTPTTAVTAAPDVDCGTIQHDSDPATADVELKGVGCGKMTVSEGNTDLGDVGFKATLSGTQFQVDPYATPDLISNLANHYLSWEMLLRALPELLGRLEDGMRASAGGGPDGGKVPIVGDALDAGANVVGTLRTEFENVMNAVGAAVDGALGDCTNPLITCETVDTPPGCSSDPGAPPENQCTGTEDQPRPTARDVEEVVQKFAWDRLGTPGAGLILHPDPSGNVALATAGTIDDITVRAICDASTSTDCDDTNDRHTDIEDLRLTFNVGKVVGTSVTNPPTFDLGFDGVPFRVAGAVGAGVGWNLLVDVGLNRQGPYLGVAGATPGYTARPSELVVDANVTLAAEPSTDAICNSEIADPASGDAVAEVISFTASTDRCLAGKLAFVGVNVRDHADDLQRTRLGLKTFMDMTKTAVSGDPNPDIITFTELVGGRLQPVVGIDVNAKVNLRFRTGIPAAQDAGFPTVAGTFQLLWGYNRSTAGVETEAQPLVVKFENLHLDIEQFFNAYLKPTVEEVRRLTGPFKPVVETLNAPLPVVSDLAALVGQPPLTLLGLMEKISDNNLTVIKSLAAFIQFANSDATYNGMIALGSAPSGGGAFAVNAADARAAKGPGEAASLIDTNPATGFSGGSNLLGRPAANSGATYGASAVQSSTNAGFGLTKDNLPGTFGVPGLTFPFMNDANQIFSFVMGADVTLVRYDIGTLQATAGFSYNFGPFFIGPVPVTAGIGGSATLQGRFAIGYDTSGLRKVLSGGSGVYLFDGIFVDDLDHAGVDVPEISLIGEVSARAGVTVFVATAGIEGGIRMTVDLNLNDKPEPDGKLRIEEIFNKLSNPLCLFDVNGKLEAFLRAFLEINYFVGSERWDWELLRITLLEFSATCELPPPVLAAVDGSGVLTLNIGDRANLRNIAADQVNEKFVVRPVGGGRYSVDAFGVYQVYGPGRPAPFSGPAVTKVVANGSGGHDTILLEPGTDENKQPGTTGYEIPFTAVGEINGGADNDIITTGDANDVVSGGPGNDRIEGGKGNDRIYGDDLGGATAATDGVDQLTGGQGHDALFGQGGGDRLQGGPGADWADGGAGNDALSGGPGAEPGASGVTPGTEDLADVLVGGADVDTVEGGWGNDVVYGDVNLGAHGTNNTANSFGVASQLSGSAALTGLGLIPANGDIAAACASTTARVADKSDALDGGPGNDGLFGGPLDDKLVGGAGSDRLCGNAGNDDLDGDNASMEATASSSASANGANDDLDGGPDQDVLRGRGGHDVLAGGDGHDVLFGGTGRDRLLGQGHNDDLSGGSGRDVLDGGDGLNVLVGDEATIAGTVGDQAALDAGKTARAARVSTPANQLARVALVSNVGTTGGGTVDCTTSRPAATSADAGAADCLTGGANDDVMFGEGGDDKITGNGGPDYARGGAGADLISGDGGTDELYGDDGADTITGGDDNDKIRGNAGADLIEGNGATDTINGDADNDRIIGGSSTSAADANDNLYGDAGEDVILGDNGTISATFVVALLDLTSTDASKYGDDIIAGGSDNDRLYGGGAQDTIDGDAGDDYAEGNPGADIIRGGLGDDDLIGGTAQAGIPDAAHDFGGTVGVVGDRIEGGDGDDVATGDNATVTRPDPQTTHPLSEGGAKVRTITLLDVATTTDAAAATLSGPDRIDGGVGSDWLFGQGDHDIIDGGAGQDLANGNGGTDTINGGDADDLLVGGTSQHAVLTPAGSTTTVTYGVALDAGDTINGGAGDDIALGDNAQIDWAGAASFEVPTPAGTFGVDTINGDAGEDRIWGQLEGDILSGGDGHDYVLGDLGTVSPYSSGASRWPAASATLEPGARRYDVRLIDPDTGGIDQIRGDAGDDHIFAGAAGDTVQGGLGDDYVEGNGGQDNLYGLASTSDDGTFQASDLDEQSALFAGTATDQDDLIGGTSSWTRPDDDVRPDEGETIMQGNAGHDVLTGDNADIVREVDGTQWAADPIIPGARKRVVVLLDREKVDAALAAVSGGDTMLGNDGSDRIYGQGGNDTAKGNANDDYLEGNQDRDWLEGNDGEDDLIGGSSFQAAAPDVGDPDDGDVLHGGAGADVVTGDNAVIARSALPSPYFTTSGRLLGFTTPRWIQLYDLSALDADRFGADLVSGGSGADVLFGQDGDDWMSGGSDDDYAEGNGGTDRMVGDRLLSALTDVPAGPAGLPTLGSDAAQLDGVQGDAGQDDLLGGSSKEAHRDARDVISGDGAADFVLGDNGTLTRLFASPAAYRIYVERYPIGSPPAGAAFIRQPVRFDVGAAAGVFGGDFIEGNAGDDTVYGQDGDDEIYGNEDHDDLYGELGTDRMFGGTGEDAMVGDRGAIVSRLIDGSPGDPAESTVTTKSIPMFSYTAFRSGTLDRRIDLLRDVDADVFGAALDKPGLRVGGGDVMRGGPGRDNMHGAFGDDLMNGDSGGDMLFGDDGSDVMFGGRGSPDAALKDDRGVNDVYVDYLFGGHGGDPANDQGVVTGGADVIDYKPRVGTDPQSWHDLVAPYADEPLDQHHQGIDWIYGGWDRDVMQADVADVGPNQGDRLVDWTGAYNLYTHCPADYGGFNDIRQISPEMLDFLERLAYGSGAGTSLADVKSSTSSAFRELGLVHRSDINDNAGKAYPGTPGHFTEGACS